MILTPRLKYILIGSAVLVVFLGTWLWIGAAQRDAANLARAEEQERVKNVLAEETAKREREKEIERQQIAKLIDANNQMAERLQQTITQNNQESARLRALLLAPKPVQEVIRDSQDTVHITPRAEPENRVSVTKEEFQSLLALKPEVDRLTRNEETRERQFRLLEDTNTRQAKLIEGYIESMKGKDALIASQEKVIESYKKVAKKTRLRRVGEVTGKVAIAVFGGYVGMRLGR